MKWNQSLVDHAVQLALQEDIGSGDITAQLIDVSAQAKATVITREAAVVAGRPWFDAVFRQLDPAVSVYWLVNEGETLLPDQVICYLKGAARSLLTGERCALNFLQTLSGVATVVAQYVAALRGLPAKLLDTRKTLPGLRYAQKYAVRCGGGENHRMGLFDAFLIKENHIASCGSITQAVRLARKYHPERLITVEVEDMVQLDEALRAGCQWIMLDNFSLSQTRDAVVSSRGRAKLEVSGGIDLCCIRQYAETGVDFISIGALTKHVRSIDLSMSI